MAVGHSRTGRQSSGSQEEKAGATNLGRHGEAGCRNQGRLAGSTGMGTGRQCWAGRHKTAWVGRHELAAWQNWAAGGWGRKVGPGNKAGCGVKSKQRTGVTGVGGGHGSGMEITTVGGCVNKAGRKPQGRPVNLVQYRQVKLPRWARGCCGW